MAGLDSLTAEIGAIRSRHRIGRVTGISGTTVTVDGLADIASPGDHCRFDDARGAEVVTVAQGAVTVFADGGSAGLRLGDTLRHVGPAVLRPADSWLGRVIDPLGHPLDGRALLRGADERPVLGQPPAAATRRALGPRVATGLRVFDTLLPIARGQRIGLFAGSGVGKSTLLGRLAMGLAADVVVIAMVGERGRELRDFIDRVLGPAAMDRVVIVAATSDQPASLRRLCAPAAMTVAEHFRDQGRQVLYLADSVTRLAEAHREIALAAGEPAGPGGHPASVTPLIQALCERAGPGTGSHADITALFSVLVPASDMEDPIADLLRGTLDGHVVLDRAIAERGRFPAIDVTRSVSRSLPGVASDRENMLIGEARTLLSAYGQSELMLRAGLYAEGSDTVLDRAIGVWPELDRFVAEPAHDGVEASFRRLARCLSDASNQGDPDTPGASSNDTD